MKLLIDVGNTRTKYCMAKEEGFRTVTTVLNSAFNAEYFNSHFLQVTQCIIANVADQQITLNINSWAQAERIPVTNVESERFKNGVTAAYNDITTLGVDRWLAILGAHSLYPNKNLIVIDAGTATTVDVVNQAGQHLGGWILPGIMTMLTSLAEKTDKVRVACDQPSTLTFGDNTSACVNNACWAATLGLITQAKLTLVALGEDVDHIIITGGDAQALLSLSSENMQHSAELVFIGLLQYS